MFIKLKVVYKTKWLFINRKVLNKTESDFKLKGCLSNRKVVYKTDRLFMKLTGCFIYKTERL